MAAEDIILRYRENMAGIARYVKEVNAMEETIKFYQAIFDGNGKLIEMHEKFPVDKGHRKVKEV
jgi:hypothetical protein